MIHRIVLWLYWIPTWELAIVIFVAMASGSILGLFISRRWLLRHPHKGNDLIFNFVASAGLVYALVLGLIAVATWEKFSAVEAVVAKEAYALNDLFFDVGGLDDHTRLTLQQEIRDYLNLVVEKEWPAQKLGTIIEGGAPLARQMARDMIRAESTTERQKIVHSQALVELNNFLTARRARRYAMEEGLPAILYFLVLGGAGVLIMMTYALWTEEFHLQLILTLGLVATISMVILLIVAMDHPLWGQVGVSAEAYRNVLANISQ